MAEEKESTLNKIVMFILQLITGWGLLHGN